MQLRTIISLALCSLSLTAATAASPTVGEIAPYVYPSNATNQPPQMAWMPDGQSYLTLSDDGKKIVKCDPATGKVTATIFDATHTRENTISAAEAFIISPDGTRLLIRTATQSIYRHSFSATFFTFEISRNILLPLSEAHPRQMAPVWSADSRMVAFVASDNNIYLKKLTYNSEVAVTTDGAQGKIINGTPDWVYEEEFKTTGSMQFSPDNSTLCYLKYDESDVPLYTLPIYDSFCSPDSRYALYPGAFSYKYPVAGQPNSRVSLLSYDIDTRKTKLTEFPQNADIEYIARIAFVPSQPATLLAATLNRDQNKLMIFSVNPKSTIIKNILTETDAAWIDPVTYEDMTLEADWLTILSSRSGFRHIYRYSYSGSLLEQLTSGDFNVTDYYGTDPATGAVYYRSTSTGSVNRVIERLEPRKGTTTLLSPEHGTASARFAPGMRFYTLTYSNLTTPPRHTLHSTSAKHSELRELADNNSLCSRFPNLPRRELTTVAVNGTELNAYIIRPAGFNPSKRYPVILTQYSGPGSQQVTDSWQLDWEQYAATKGYAVVCIDPRGTGGKSRSFETIVYRDLGHYETLDLIAGIRALCADNSWMDADRIGIQGWSYGGYETLMCATEPDAPFKAAVAIAPVTDWRLYDSIYTERYMATPQQNEEGYNSSAPLRRAAGMNTDLLLIYGTSDDNVHPANTIEFVSALQAHNQLCSMLIFPNMNHSINGCNARAQVYAAMIDHFNRSLR